MGFCGGGTAPFRDWAPLLDDDTELVLVCYPGREGRFLEPACRTWDELAGDTTGVVRSVTDRPYVLFGHSMGGWMAFDVAVRLEREGSRVPDLLVVSSCNSPDRGVTDRDRYPCKENTDAELVEWMGDGGLLPEYVRGDDDLLEMAVDLMRADVRVRDTYAYTSGAGTSAPVHVLHGGEDALMDPDLAGEWPRVCVRPPRVTRLPGGHFYTPEIWRELPRWFSMTQGGTMARQRFDVTRRAGGPAFAEVPDVHGVGEACDWLTGHAAGVREALDRHGALFLRGLGISGPDDFAAVRDVLLPQRAAYREKATPRSDFGNDVFSSTDLPPAQRIRHAQREQLHADVPGNAAVRLPGRPRVRRRDPGRRLPGGAGERCPPTWWTSSARRAGSSSATTASTSPLDWRTAFGTTSHEDVERYCEENLISCRWGPDGHAPDRAGALGVDHAPGHRRGGLVQPRRVLERVVARTRTCARCWSRSSAAAGCRS